MRIFIDGKFVIPQDGAVFIVLDDEDKKALANMQEEYNIYCSYDPGRITKENITEIGSNLKDVVAAIEAFKMKMTEDFEDDMLNSNICPECQEVVCDEGCKYAPVRLNNYDISRY